LRDLKGDPLGQTPDSAWWFVDPLKNDNFWWDELQTHLYIYILYIYNIYIYNSKNAKTKAGGCSVYNKLIFSQAETSNPGQTQT
jgi:hypothetical protein